MRKRLQKWLWQKINYPLSLKTILCFLGSMLIFLSSCVTRPSNLFHPTNPPLGFDYQAVKTKKELSPPEFKAKTKYLTLRQALALALINNPELQAFSYEIRAQEARAIQAGLIANPEISVEMENIYGQGPFRKFEAAETTIQLSQLVELGRKPAKRKKIALIESDLKSWDYEAKRIEVLSQVTKAFIAVLSAQERLNITQELVNLTRQFRDSVAARVQAGKVSPVELTRADISVAFAEVQMSKAKKLLEAARQKLAATWGSFSPDFNQVVGRLYSVIEPPPLNKLVGYLQRHPELARWKAERALREARLSLAKAGLIPDVMISGGIRYFQETNDRAYVLNLSFPLPIFNRQQGTIRVARYYLEKTDLDEKAILLHFQTKLKETYRLLQAYHHQVITLQKTVIPAAQNAFEAIKEGYQQGKFSFLDVLDAQRTLVEAKIQYIESLGAYHQTVAEIEKLINGPLTTSQEKNKEKVK
ncbi:TolC family protein [Candidatus Aminicenantes bacterium AC-334-K16]|jgi:cobalt-zinc-cadmium efflux system outer membrane protein|nr:TolC family protein [Candidatus Aminicenantes bacterium AC-334-K16]